MTQRPRDNSPTDELRPKPWDRLEGESPQAHASLREYLALGPRRGLRQLRTVGLRKAAQWSSSWRWVERAAAWDAEIARQADLEAADEAKVMARRHIQIAQSFQTKLVQRLQALNPLEMSVTDMARWFELSVRIERETRGLAGSTVDHRLSADESPVSELVRRILSSDETTGAALDLLDSVAGPREPVEAA